MTRACPTLPSARPTLPAPIIAICIFGSRYTTSCLRRIQASSIPNVCPAREDEVLDTLVQRQRDGQAAPRMIHKLFKKQGRRRNRKFADSPLEGTGFEISVPVRQAKLTRFCR